MELSRRLERNSMLLIVIGLGCVVANASATREGRTIVVGDSQGWRVGTNYTEWATKNSPFHINDTLVFKYPAADKLSGGIGNESVYLLPNLWSFITCDFKDAKLLSETEGIAKDFNIQLNQWKPYYFASSDGNGYDCIAGLNKFIALPYPTTTTTTTTTPPNYIH